jgi:phosphate transport system permease protein
MDAPLPSPSDDAAHRSRRRRWLGFADGALLWGARASGVVVLLMLASLVVVLTMAAWPSFKAFGPSFLTSTEWRPNELERPLRNEAGQLVIEDGETVMEVVPPDFGALPVVYGTLVSSILALAFAVPLSLGAAVFLVRVAPTWKIAGPLSFLVEFLAAIPSLAYGVWGLFVLAPLLQDRVEPFLRTVLGPVPGLGWMFRETVDVGGQVITRDIPLTGRDMLCGSLILAIMIVPIITAISRDVLKAVPRVQIEGSIAMGATWWQSTWSMLRYSRSGLAGAIMLGLARAAGETMAVTMVLGNNNRISPSPFAPAQTMASLLANEFAEASSTLHRSALLQVALILLVMSLFINILARWLVGGSQAHSAAAH